MSKRSRPSDEEQPPADVAAVGPSGIREPDEGALPVATFTEEDFAKRDTELPSERWLRRGWRILLPATLAAVASGLGLLILSMTPGYDGLGPLGVMVAPIVIGTLVSLFPARREESRGRQPAETSIRGSVAAGVMASLLVSLLALPFLGEGALCVLMALPFFAVVSASTSLGANKLVSRFLKKLDDKHRATLGALLVLLLPLAAGLLDPWLFFDASARSVVTSSITLPHSRAEVWRSLRHLDVRFAEPSPWSLEALLPVPVAIRGDGAELGGVRRVEFHNGTVVATVTRLEEERAYEIGLVLENPGREFFNHWIDLERSRFDLVDAGPVATRLVHATTYRPILFPRAVFEPLEQAFGGVIQQRLVEVYAAEVLGARPLVAAVQR